jgi:hypothetical protein
MGWGGGQAKKKKPKVQRVSCPGSGYGWGLAGRKKERVKWKRGLAG